MCSSYSHLILILGVFQMFFNIIFYIYLVADLLWHATNLRWKAASKSTTGASQGPKPKNPTGLCQVKIFGTY